jgi:hypothetical protein
VCLKCLKAPHKIFIFTKWNIKDIEELLNRVKNWLENNFSQEVPEVLQLCNGNFMGTASYCYVLKGKVKLDNTLVIDTNSNANITHLPTSTAPRVKIDTVQDRPAKLSISTSNITLKK